MAAPASRRAALRGVPRCRRPGGSCRSAAWGCVASACRHRWRGRAPGPRCAALLLKLLNFSCSWCSFPSDHSDHFLVNINTRRSRPARRGACAAPASSSCMSMTPSSNRDMASISGVGSDKISAVVFVLSQNLLLWRFQILGRKLLFVKRALWHHPYTYIFDVI